MNEIRYSKTKTVISAKSDASTSIWYGSPLGNAVFFRFYPSLSDAVYDGEANVALHVHTIRPSVRALAGDEAAIVFQRSASNTTWSE